MLINSCRRRIRRGFTLKELLVVVAIMAVLVAMLIPLLGRARRASRTVVCLSNLHQLQQSFLQYSILQDTPQSLSSLMATPAPTDSWTTTLNARNAGLYRVLVCPEALDTRNNYGSATMAWGPTAPAPYGGAWMNNLAGSYGINAWLSLGALAQSAGAGLVSQSSNVDINGTYTVGDVQAGSAISVGPQVTYGTLTGNTSTSLPNIPALYGSLAAQGAALQTSNTLNFTQNPILYVSGDWSPGPSVQVTGTGTLAVGGAVQLQNLLGGVTLVCRGDVKFTGRIAISNVYCGGNFSTTGGQGTDIGAVVAGGSIMIRGHGTIGLTSGPWGTQQPTADSFPSLTAASPATQIPVFADSIWVEASPTSNDPVPADLTKGFFDPNGTDMMGRFCIARHGKKVNVVFLDGHAQTIDLGELWQLQWSPNFVKRVVRVP
jgi:prepilin-type N-terminal cleavage/methylation domain-containing protein/prepilin-type processing-associated H-X9-DG protein